MPSKNCLTCRYAIDGSWSGVLECQYFEMTQTPCPVVFTEPPFTIRADYAYVGASECIRDAEGALWDIGNCPTYVEETDAE